MLAMPVAAIAAFPLVQALARRSATRTTVLAGLAAEAAGLAGIALALSSDGVLWLIPGLAIHGVGVGGATAQLSMLVLGDVPAPRSSLASRISTAVRQLGSSLGVALLGLLFSGVVGRTSETLAEQPVQEMAGARAAGDPAVVERLAGALSDGWEHEGERGEPVYA
jgi:hypothetical protein